MTIYEGKIMVVCEDKSCFPVDPKTLEATHVSIYDPYWYLPQENGPIETISFFDWLDRKRIASKISGEGDSR